MKTQTFTLTAMLLLGFAIHANADQVISLKDGTQLRGELVSLSNGVYTIKTSTMGQVTVTAGNIVNITNGDAINQARPMMQQIQPMPGQAQGQQAGNGNNAPLVLSQDQINQKFKETQSQLLANPQAIAEIQEMAKDPEIMKILSDPTLIQSVTNRDVNGISSNPKTQQLLNNPKMKALLEKLQTSGQ